MTRFLGCVCTILLLMPAITFGQDRSFPEEYRNTPFSITRQVAFFYPSHLALGYATVAADGDLGLPDVNPATIGEPDVVGFGFDVGGTPFFASDWPFFDLDLYTLTPTLTYRRGRWAGAAQVKYLNDGTLEFRDDSGTQVITGDAEEYVFRASGAYALTPRLRVGAGLVLTRESADVSENQRDAVIQTSQTTTAVALDLGVHYARMIESGDVRLRPAFGASLIGFGPTVTRRPFDPLGTRVLARTRDVTQPMIFRVGGAFGVESTEEWAPGKPLVKATFFAALRKDLTGGEFVRSDDGYILTVVGASGTFSIEEDPYGPFEALFKTWDAYESPGLDRSISAWGQIEKQVGAELRILDVGVFRVGGRYADPAVAPDVTAFGIGVDLDYVRFDYVEPGSPEDRSNIWTERYFRLTAVIPLGGAPSPIWNR